MKSFLLFVAGLVLLDSLFILRMRARGYHEQTSYLALWCVYANAAILLPVLLLF